MQQGQTAFLEVVQVHCGKTQETNEGRKRDKKEQKTALHNTRKPLTVSVFYMSTRVIYDSRTGSEGVPAH